MTTLNPNTKKAQQMLSSYAWARRDPKSLYGAYATCSDAKGKAWEYCEELCKKLGGTHLCVTGHNTCTFSAAFETQNTRRVHHEIE